MEVNPRAVEAQNGGLKSHNRATEVSGAAEAQNGGLKSHNRATEVSGAAEAQNGGLKSHNTVEPWRFTL